jgi:hypothetical protein
VVHFFASLAHCISSEKVDNDMPFWMTEYFEVAGAQAI